MTSVAGFRHFFSPLPIDSVDLKIHGIGVNEPMPPGLIQRPQGKGDYLVMRFHDPVIVGCSEESASSQPSETLMIWTPGKGHFYGTFQSRFNHSWIHCEGRQIRRILRETKLPLNEPIHGSDPFELQRALLEVHRELVAYLHPDPVIVTNLLESCLRQLARSLADPQTTTRIPENLLAVRRLIGTAPAQKMTLTTMARMAGMSVPYFCARFKETFGLPPMECLIRHRMDHAVHLLDDRNLSLTEIARQVGYEDAFHFSKTFKKRFGSSPRAMRQRG